MVATLARLRLRLLRNTLRREPWRIVLLALGALWGLAMVPLVVAGLVVLGVTAEPEVRDAVLVLAGSALVLGWVVVPVVAFGLDDTLDPQRFSPLVAPSPRFAFALFVAGAVSVPGVVTVIACLATAIVWLGQGDVGQRLATAALALVMGALGAVLCLLLARVATTAAAGVLRGRRGRDVAGIIATFAVLAVALLPSAVQGVEFRLPSLTGVAQALAWSPVGAPWAVPADVAAGAWGTAAARLAIVLVTLALAGVAYLRLLRRSMTGVGSGGGPAGTRSGRLPFAHALLAWLGRPREVLGLPLTAGTAAVAGRCLRYWRGDPRYLASAGSISVLPLLAVLIAAISTTQGEVEPAAAFGIASLVLAPILAWFGPWSIHNDVAYDSSAFWLHVATGVRGAEDRLGRVLGMAVWVVPLSLVLAVVPPVLLDRGAYVPAVLGGTLALLGAGFGISSVASAVLPYPAPPPGANPLGTQSGFTVAALGQLASFVGLGVLVLPTALTLIPVVAVGPAWGWLTLAVGLATGAACLVVGVRKGGALLEARSVDVLTPDPVMAQALRRRIELDADPSAGPPTDGVGRVTAAGKRRG